MNRLMLSMVTGAAVLLAGPVYGQNVVKAQPAATEAAVPDSVLQELESLKKKIDMLEAAIAIEAMTPTVEENSVVIVAPTAAAPRPAAESPEPWYKKLSMKVSGTGILQGTPGLKTDNENSVDAALSIDLGITMQTSKRGKVYVQLETSHGAGLDGHIHTFSQFNNDADGEHDMRATRYWYQYSFDNGLRLNVGKIKMADYFDTNRVANSETHQFFSTGFVNNRAIEFPNTKSFGAVLWYTPNDLFDIGAGYAEADANWNDVFKDPFVMLELGFKPKIFGRQGEYRAFGWYNGKDHTRYESLLRPEMITNDANYGFGVMLDQDITKDITVYGRYGHQRGTGFMNPDTGLSKQEPDARTVTDPSVLAVEHAWSVGGQRVGTSWGRPKDVLGVAYGQGIISDSWEKYALNRGFNPGNESTLEIYYSYKATPHWTFSPDLQWRKNPNGNKNEENNWAIGLRTQFDL